MDVLNTRIGFCPRCNAWTELIGAYDLEKVSTPNGSYVIIPTNYRFECAICGQYVSKA